MNSEVRLKPSGTSAKKTTLKDHYKVATPLDQHQHRATYPRRKQCEKRKSVRFEECRRQGHGRRKTDFSW